jgi:hypothetical protein
LVKLGKLDAATLVDRLSRGELAAVQLCCSIDFLKGDDDPFIIPQTLSALQTSYELALAHEGCYIYVPKNAPPRSSEAARIGSPTDGSPIGRQGKRALVSH